ncbi:MAG: hypothetical protein JXR95_01460 [Deltaproteobacteria bacterium]|nr:hypothetical protein [Deltaproteobacteria bacterium]
MKKKLPRERRTKNCPWHPGEVANCTCQVCHVHGCGECIKSYNGIEMCPECRKRRRGYRLKAMLISLIFAGPLILSGYLMYSSLSKDKKGSDEVQKYSKKLLKDPRDDFSRIKLIALYEARGETLKAVSHLESIVSRHPRETYYLRKLVRMYLKLKKASRALELTQKLHSLEPDNHENYKLEGKAHQTMGSFQQAEKSYLVAYSLFPRDMDLIYSIVGLYTELNRHREAEQILSDALTRVTDSKQRKMLYKSLDEVRKQLK